MPHKCGVSPQALGRRSRRLDRVSTQSRTGYARVRRREHQKADLVSPGRFDAKARRAASPTDLEVINIEQILFRRRRNIPAPWRFVAAPQLRAPAERRHRGRERMAA